MKHLHHQPADMEKRQCSLRFDQHTDNFVSLLEYFRAKELYCDATIACDGKKYRVHQVILSTCSEFFAEIFASSSCKNPVVVLQDVNRFHLECLLTYIYRGEVHVPQQELQTFVNVAKSLYIKGLSNHAVHEEGQSSTEQDDRTWHKTFHRTKKLPDAHQYRAVMHPTLEFHRSLGKLPRIQHTEEINHYRSFCQTADDLTFKLQHRLRENQYHARLEKSSVKRSHDSMEHPEDLSKRRVSISEERYPNKQLDDNDYKRLQDEDCARGMNERQISRLSPENNSECDDEKPELNNQLRTICQRGSFQELIAADDRLIKQEPDDYDIESDCKSGHSLDEANDMAHEDNDDDDEHNLHIYDDHNAMRDGSGSPQMKTEASSDHDESLVLSPSEASIHDQPHSSQLRRELLCPAPHHMSSVHSQHHSITPQSIPHPVIALREPQGKNSHQKPQSPPALREPPPLMKILPKISELMGEDDNTGVQRMMKNLPANRNNSSHLLVSAPPTYHSHTNKSQNPHHFTLEIHNQQLGQVFVNGGTHLAVKNPFLYARPQSEKGLNKNTNSLDIYRTNDGPLNLSGHHKRTSPPLADEIKGDDDPFLGKILTNRKKRLRGPKSWEFLVRLLKDPTTNPAFIRWENKETGVFRLVQPSVIAQRWGRRTGKHASENLTYENFARGLRYHYATGALKPVSEKSFVYRLGPKAIKLLEDYDSSQMPFL